MTRLFTVIALALLPVAAAAAPLPSGPVGPSNPREALITLLLAQARILYHARRCADPTAVQGVQGWSQLVIPSLRYT
jgi:hypothetical protein